MEDKNIFEGAKFGDTFLTRDGHIAIVTQMLGENIYCEVEERFDTISYFSSNLRKYRYDGVCVSNMELDIVSRYQEPTDECTEKLTNKILKWCRNNSIAEYMGVDSWTFEEELKKALNE